MRVMVLWILSAGLVAARAAEAQSSEACAVVLVERPVLIEWNGERTTNAEAQQAAAAIASRLETELSSVGVPVVRTSSDPRRCKLTAMGSYESGRTEDVLSVRVTQGNVVVYEGEHLAAVDLDHTALANAARPAARAFRDANRTPVNGPAAPSASAAPSVAPGATSIARPVAVPSSPPATPTVVPSPPAPPSPSASGSAEQVYALLERTCHSCHGGDGPPEKGVVVLDYDALVRSKNLVPGDIRSPILSQVLLEKMPQDGDLEPAEVQLLQSWVVAGAPRWGATTPVQLLPTMNGDALASLAERDYRKFTPDNQKYLRYVSFAHLTGRGLAATALAGHRAALAKAINSTSWKLKFVRPVQVDEVGLLLRFDLRDLGWTLQQWSKLVEDYPYDQWGAFIPAKLGQFGELTPAKRVVARPRREHTLGVTDELLVVRADWLVEQVTSPAHYHALLELPTMLSRLEDMLGVDRTRAVSEETSVLATGQRNSGVSQHNRAVHRYESKTGGYYLSFDFASSEGPSDILANPLALRPAGHEVIFTLPNGLHGYMITDGVGRRIDEAPTTIVSDRTRPDRPAVVNGRSCLSCHFEGLKALGDDVAPHLAELTSVDYDLRKARAIYRGKEAMEAARLEDQQRYEQALTSLGISPLPRRPRDEPIARTLRAHELDLDLAAVASEAFMKPDELRKVLARADDALGFKRLLAVGGALTRTAWESSYITLLDLLPNEQAAITFDPSHLTFDPKLAAAAAEASRVAMTEPARAEKLYRSLLNAKTKLCDEETLTTCHELAQDGLDELGCRRRQKHPVGFDSVESAQQAVLEALRARDVPALERTMSCHFWIGVTETDVGSSLTPSKAAPAIMALIHRESWNPRVKATAIEGRSGDVGVQLGFRIEEGRVVLANFASNDEATLGRLNPQE